MSHFYYNKYYRFSPKDKRYYIPLKSISVDVDRLKQEVDTLIGPLTELGYGITTAKEHVNEVPVRYNRYTGISNFNKLGERVLANGETDEQIVFWPKFLENSYMKELGDLFSKLINIPNPRVRLSSLSEEDFIDFHNDPHTPYRIHIALETHPDARWIFKKDPYQIEYIHQPADGVPVLIETGRTEHAVQIASPGRRVHLWYQFHGIVNPAILNTL
jgi:hypothetical protein